MSDDPSGPTPATGKEETPKVPEVLPVLPLRDIVIFPFMIVPLYVSRERSIKAVDAALPDDMFTVGTVALIMRMLKLPDGRIRVLVQGVGRARIKNFDEGHPFLQAHIESIQEPEPDRKSTRLNS